MPNEEDGVHKKTDDLFIAEYIWTNERRRKNESINIKMKCVCLSTMFKYVCFSVMRYNAGHVFSLV